MNSKPPEDFQDGRRELEVAEDDATDAALEKLKPLLKPEKVKEARIVLTRMVSKSHSGPIPSAEELEHLEQVLPGAAARCFEMAEREQAHRHEMNLSVVSREFSLRGRGQWIALAALVLLLIVVGWLAYLGDTNSAAWLGGATIVGVVSIFATGKFIEAKSDEAEKPSAVEAPQKPAVVAQNQNRKRRSTNRR